MQYWLCFVVCLFVWEVTAGVANDDSTEIDYSSDLYDAMKEAYYEENWSSCVSNGLAAVAQFKQQHNKIIKCRRNCHGVQKQRMSGQDNLLRLYMISLPQITCISRCKSEIENENNNNNNNIGNIHSNASYYYYTKYLKNHLEREPYDFIQVCYFKLGHYSKGAAAATTFLVANPHHSYMKTNIQNYKDHLHVKEQDFIDLEAGMYESLYKKGVDLYEEEKWSEQAQCMEDALDNYHQSYSDCSLTCEAGYDTLNEHDSNHELVGAIADQLERVIKCKRTCKSRLSKLNLNPSQDILANIYHHLQYAYSKVGDVKRGAAYASAFLLHHPDDKGMMKNKNYLLNVGNAQQEWFKAPQRERDHKERLDELEQLIRYLSTEYISQHSQGKDERDRQRMLSGFLNGNVKVEETSEMLGGRERFVADGFASQQQCNSLIGLCKEFGLNGDGYEMENPMSPHEHFQGLSIDSAAKRFGIAGHNMGGNPTPFTEHELVYAIGVNETKELVEERKIDSSLLEMYLNLSELSRNFTQLYFNLHELYFDYTHLVCRTALDDSADRDDLSHPIHSDNCFIQEDGSCLKEPPAYIQRDYSGLLYLNEDFEGGEFFFTDKHLHEQSSVKPKCGRLVAFNAADYHGVKAVNSGRRCAIAVWFTMDPAFEETSRQWAQRVVDKSKLTARDEL